MVFYFVQRGETLYHIARRYGTSVHAIVSANRLEDPNDLTPGQALVIPPPGEEPVPAPGGVWHVVRAGESVFDLARRFGAPPARILRANHLAHPEFLLPGQRVVIPEPPGTGDEWPVLGRTPGRESAAPLAVGGPPLLAWRVPVPPGPPGCRAIPSPPVIRYGLVYAGRADGTYGCWQLRDGSARWRVDVEAAGGARLAAPAVFDGLVYVAAPGGTVLGADARSGEVAWRTRCGEEPAAPVVADDLVYVAASGGVWALEVKTGTRVWHRELAGALVQAPALEGDCLYVVTGRRLAALDRTTGALRWEREVSATLPPVCGCGLVVVGGEALDAATGSSRWSVPEVASPALAGDVAVYPGGAVDVATGRYRWRAHGGPGGAGPHSGDEEPGAADIASPDGGATPEVAAWPVIAGETVLRVVDGDWLEARRLADGAVRWRYPLPAPALHAPALAPGHIVIVLIDGSLAALCLTGACTPAT